MSDTIVGVILDGPQERDAIHIAVAPVVAAEDLKPGQQVGFVEEGNITLVGPALLISDPIGIVDPFLKTGPTKGQQFWMFLFPKTITSLKHNWSHPAFIEADAKVKKINPNISESIAWITKYVEEWCPYDPSFKSFMARVNEGEIFHHGRDLHSYRDLENPEELFHHLSVVLGRTVNKDSFTYHCSC